MPAAQGTTLSADVGPALISALRVDYFRTLRRFDCRLSRRHIARARDAASGFFHGLIAYRDFIHARQLLPRARSPRRRRRGPFALGY